MRYTELYLELGSFLVNDGMALPFLECVWECLCLRDKLVRDCKHLLGRVWSSTSRSVIDGVFYLIIHRYDWKGHIVYGLHTVFVALQSLQRDVAVCFI